MENQTKSIHYRACNLCEAICGLEIEVENNQITHVRGDKADPFSRGHICPKAVALIDIQSDPRRITKPLIRDAGSLPGEFREATIEEAITLVASRIAATRQVHGANSIAAYQGNPSVHNIGLYGYASAVLGLLKTQNRFTASTLDQMPTQLVAHWMYGHQFLIPIPDFDHTGYILMLGANPGASNGSLMTIPDFAHRAKALRERSAKFVLIDPRRTETAEHATAHHFIKPGTDAAFLSALIHVIFRDNLVKLGRLADFTDGLNELSNLFLHMPPSAAQDICGIHADVIEQIAHDFSTSKSAVAYGRMGTSVQANGTVCQWLIQLLNVVTGNLDRVGGALVATPAADIVGAMGKGSYGRWKSRVRGLSEVNGELPAVCMAEEMLTTGEGQIRAFITIAGNPVLSSPDGKQLERALLGLDFMVCVDNVVNETTRFAHVILPSATAMEAPHYDNVFNAFAVHTVTRWNAPVVNAPQGVLQPHDLLLRLSAALGEALNVPARILPAPEPMVDALLAMGSAKAYAYKAADGLPLTVSKLKEHPHGLVLGPLQSSFPDRLLTENKRIHAAPILLVQALEKALADFSKQTANAFTTNAQTAGDMPLLLIGRRHVRSNNSWMHRFHRLTKGKARTQIMMHPSDAENRGIADGDAVTVHTADGMVNIAVEVSDAVMAGVVCLPHGFGHRRDNLVNADLEPNVAGGVSFNDLSSTNQFEPLCGNAILTGIQCEVAKA